MRSTLVIGAALTFLSGTAIADVVYISQARSVSAYADNATQTASATDFSGFSATVTDFAEFPWGDSSATARQNSILGASAITASGLASASGSPSRSSASARSSVDVVFDLTVASDVELSGVLSGIPDFIFGGATFVQLERVGGPVLARFDGSQIELGNPWIVDFTGSNAFRATLEAGRYRITTEVRGAVLDQSLGSSFEWTLSGIPTPGSLTALGLAGLATVRRKRG